MYSIRKWLYRPKRSDTSLLAQFFYADEELNLIASELDSFDGRKDPERCAALVNKLRQCQDAVLIVTQKIMSEAIPHERANRDFRVKFPDDVLQESLAGQLWFGAECLAAGSSIMNREVESASMRPLARALTKNLDSLRSVLRDQCLKNIHLYTDRIKESLVLFDKLFAEFELSYVSAMVPVKTMREYDLMQEVIILFSETVHRALKLKLISQDMVDDCDPALMFTIPRLAIVCGLLIYPEGPLNPDNDPFNITEMFRPFLTLLFKIRELLYTLSKAELFTLEKSLCSVTEPPTVPTITPPNTREPTQRPTTLTQTSNHLLTTCDHHGYLDALGGPIIVRTPTCESPVTPVTPVNEDPELLCRLTSSPSIITIIAQTHRTTDMDSAAQRLDNTSEDSGHLSENLSECGQNVTHSGGLSAQTSLDDDTVQKCDICNPQIKVPTKSCSNCDHDQTSYTKCTVTDPSCTCVKTCTKCTGTDPSCTCVETAPHDRISCTKCAGMDSMCTCVETTPHTLVAEASLDSGTNSPCSSQENIAHRGTLIISSVEIHTPSSHQSQDNSSQSQPSTQTDAESGTDDLRIDHSHIVDDFKDRCRSALITNTKITSQKSDSSPNEEEKLTQLDVPSINVAKLADNAPQVSDNAVPCSSTRTNSDMEWDRDSCASSETCSYSSEYHDDEEIALAIQAAELASRNESRARFRSSMDLLHRLFVCVSGVADQLQTNHASDLRNILKAVFEINCTESPVLITDECNFKDMTSTAASLSPRSLSALGGSNPRSIDPPVWVPDVESPACGTCQVPFTIMRRRHHCRNCGKIFCSRCSSNSVSLPHYGHTKPVRVCNRCFMFQVTPFTMSE